ncbi:uncharacterized protein LOC122372005 isoform X2 [Amphibalanus amphitrite]|uniref:uncharacterized protein LOC122372005 isoform X2 n=1 Tax=Amphibalanus amphitrite TaxID=1232801 RepID=UPI001C929F0F|nr:uncharacterized protein LOC122372005 isoform X2 [Amphibalanus amphitrite]
MPLLELPIPLLRRLAGLCSPASRCVVLSLTHQRPTMAPLHLPSDDADDSRGAGDRAGRPETAYAEPTRSRRKFVERFLRRELGLSWSCAEREAARWRLPTDAGLPLLADNLAFLTERGVQLRHLQQDVDVLAVPHGDLLRVHGLVSGLPCAEFCHYYPLSRARPDLVEPLFRRLPTPYSNLVHQLADTLQLPELTVSRAVSRMASQVIKNSPEKLLSSARLLTELGVPVSELGRSLYLLRLTGARLRRRAQQCRKHGVPLRAHYLAMTDDNFQRRVARGGPLCEETEDVALTVALRLGVSRDRVVEQTRCSDVLRTLRAGRLETVTGLLERAGYGPAERLAALLTVYRGRPERLRHRLELCRRLGRPKPSLAVLAMDQRRFETRLARWARTAGAEEPDRETVRTEDTERQ